MRNVTCVVADLVLEPLPAAAAEPMITRRYRSHRTAFAGRSDSPRTPVLLKPTRLWRSHTGNSTPNPRQSTMRPHQSEPLARQRRRTSTSTPAAADGTRRHRRSGDTLDRGTGNVREAEPAMSEDVPSWARRIRALREARGWSQVEATE